MIVCVEEHRISGVVGACVRVVFKRACVSRHLMAIAWRIIDDDLSLQIVRDIMTICLSSSQDDDSMMIVSVERSIGHVWETPVHRLIQHSRTSFPLACRCSMTLLVCLRLKVPTAK